MYNVYLSFNTRFLCKNNTAHDVYDILSCFLTTIADASKQKLFVNWNLSSMASIYIIVKVIKNQKSRDIERRKKKEDGGRREKNDDEKI